MERLKDQKADQKRLSPGTSFGDRSLQRFRLHRGGPEVYMLFGCLCKMPCTSAQIFLSLTQDAIRLFSYAETLAQLRCLLH